MLDVLGLDATEEGAYRRLVTLPSASAEDLADVMTVEVAALASALSALEEKGLVARSTGQPGHFVASPPSLALVSPSSSSAGSPSSTAAPSPTAPALTSSTSYAARARWPTDSPRCSAAPPPRSSPW
jgi:hypothetical protein